MFLILLSQGQKTEAERYFLKAIQLDPTKGNCYMHYGKICIFSFSLTYPDLILASQLSDLSVRQGCEKGLCTKTGICKF